MVSMMCIAISLLSIGCQLEAEKVVLAGQVTDSNGKAIEDVDVARTWNVYDSSPNEGVRTDKEGRFSIELKVRPKSEKGPDRSLPLFAMDKDRKLGALMVIPEKQFKTPVKLTLLPLVTLKAKLDPGSIKPNPKFTVVEIFLYESFHVIGRADWQDKEIDFLIPAGKYKLMVTGNEVQDSIEVELSGKEKEVNLGVLKIKALPKSK